MTIDYAPTGSNWRVNQDTGELVLCKIGQPSEAPTGDYTNHDMAKELLEIARCEDNSISERLQSYQTLINLFDVATRAAS